jgi:hypothetical protein
LQRDTSPGPSLWSGQAMPESITATLPHMSRECILTSGNQLLLVEEASWWWRRGLCQDSSHTHTHMASIIDLKDMTGVNAEDAGSTNAGGTEEVTPRTECNLRKKGY